MRAILKSLGRALVLSATAAAVVGLAAAPVLAATTWTVKPGGTFKGTAGKTVVTDTTKGLSVPCTSSVMNGSLKTGSGLSGTGIGTVTSLAFKGCSVAGFTVSVTITGKMPLNATAYDATTKVATIKITKIHGTFSVSSLGCSATIDGTGATAHNGKVTAKFANLTDILKVLASGNLHLYNVSAGCQSAVASGDAVKFTSSYKLSPTQHIHSP